VNIAVKSSSEIKPYLLNNGEASFTSIYIMKLYGLVNPANGSSPYKLSAPERLVKSI